MSTDSSSCYPNVWLQTWDWNNLSVSYVTPGINNSKPAVVLIHGFGACKEHWRYNIKALTDHFDVVAIDLVGFGNSSKPPSLLDGEVPTSGQGNVRYGIDFWAGQVTAFIEAHIQQPVALVGNSIGGVVALAAASQLENEGKSASGVVLIDCAQRAIDEKRVNEQPFGRRLGRPLLKTLVRKRWLTNALFRSLAQRGVIRAVLRQAYPSGSNIDDTLVDILHRPTQDSGASESFRGFINLFNDRLAPDMLSELTTAVSIIWGSKDPWEPIEEAQRWQRYDCVNSFETVTGAGHCPHDEVPDQVNPLLIEMLKPMLNKAERN